MKIINEILKSLFPSRCLNCYQLFDAQNTGLCESCFGKIDIRDSLACGMCDARLPLGKKICHKDTPYVLGSVSHYENPVIRNSIRSLKFKHLSSLDEFLGQLLITYLNRLNPEPEIFKDPNALIIPIPLSQIRLRERGFNQSALIAKPLAHHLNLPLIENLLIRTRHAIPQSQLETQAERLKNVEGVFDITNPLELAGHPIILVDDVTKTGSTLRAAARTLRSHGAKDILALVIAR